MAISLVAINVRKLREQMTQSPLLLWQPQKPHKH